MRHGDVVTLLAEYSDGALDPVDEVGVATHVNECEDCSSWLATYELLVAELGVDAARSEHPDTGLLALCAVREDELYEPDRVDLRRHLERCSPCREMLGAVREAVREARPDRTGLLMHLTSGPSVASFAKRAVVYGLMVVLAAGGLLGASMLLNRLASELSSSAWDEIFREASSPPGAARPQAKEGLAGTRTIESEQTLSVADVRVERGAAVTFRAGGAIAFGDGFEVASGARMVAVSGQGGASPRKREEPLPGGLGSE